MSDKFNFSKKVANSGFNPPQSNGQTSLKKIAGNQRWETHMGFDDNELKKHDVTQGKKGKFELKKSPVETENVKGTFWTACSYCYYKFDYEKRYEECHLRCRNCRKGFHAMTVAAPPEHLWVKCDSGNSSTTDKKGSGRRDTTKRHVVEISDSDDEKEMEVKNEAGEVKAEGFNNGEGRVIMKRVKSVGWSIKKIAGRGVKIKTV